MKIFQNKYFRIKIFVKKFFSKIYIYFQIKGRINYSKTKIFFV